MLRCLRVTALAALLFGVASAPAQAQLNFNAPKAPTDADRARLRQELRAKVTLQALEDSIAGRVAANPLYFRPGANRFRGAADGYLYCVAFDPAGALDTKTLCSQIKSDERIAFFKQEMWDAILANDFQYTNKGTYRHDNFVEYAFLLHEYDYEKFEACGGAAAGCAVPSPAVKELEAKLNDKFSKETERPLLIEFAKRYSALAERIAKERGESARLARLGIQQDKAQQSAAEKEQAAARERERQAQAAERERRRAALKANPLLVKTLSDAELFHDAADGTGLAPRPPLEPDQKMYSLTGKLVRKDGTLYLVQLGRSYWAFRATPQTQPATAGLRVDDLLGVVGKLTEVIKRYDPDLVPYPMVVLEASYLTNDEALIRGR